MRNHILVCPYDRKLLDRMRSKAAVIRVPDIEKAISAYQYAKDAQVMIHCILVETQLPLAAIDFITGCENIPLAVYVSGLGNFRDFINKIAVLRKMNLRVFMPTSPPENFQSLRIISSLGIDSGVLFMDTDPDWDLLTDLMTYSLLGQAPHGAIEPFNYIAGHQNSTGGTDFSAVYFRDPSRYLHVDGQGQVALSGEDLAAGKFLAVNLDQHEDIEQSEEYLQRLEGWKEIFLQNEGCAYCQGFRVCLGKFRNFQSNGQGCKQFFVELMETAEQFQDLEKKRNPPKWQP